jgi:MoaA/NifB/PqqE/SkfB family radical SAM enzyme
MAQRDHIPREKMMEIIDDLSDMGVKALTFSGGGDPLVYPYLVEALRKLSLTKTKLACLTNGSRLQGEAAEIFAHRGTWVRISIDGWNDESYAAMRGVALGEFNRVIRNMEAFKKLGGKCYLGASVVVSKDNAPHVYELIRILKDIGIDSVKVSPCIVSNEGIENNAYHRPLFETVKEQIALAKSDVEDSVFEVFDAYHELDEKFVKDYTWCPYIQILTVIAADLNVYSCQDKAYNLDCGILGSIKEQSFQRMWFSDRSLFFGINPHLHCNHHCVANNKNRQVLDYLNVDEEHMDFV